MGAAANGQQIDDIHDKPNSPSLDNSMKILNTASINQPINLKHPNFCNIKLVQDQYNLQSNVSSHSEIKS